jgi:hypothetical protein
VLWSQKSARKPGAPVVWDYHVVLVVRRRRQPEPSASANTPGQSDDVAHGGGLASASRLDPGYDRTEASGAQQAHGAGSTVSVPPSDPDVVVEALNAKEEAIVHEEDSEEEGKHGAIIDDDVVAWVYDMDSECVPPTPVLHAISSSYTTIPSCSCPLIISRL